MPLSSGGTAEFKENSSGIVKASEENDLQGSRFRRDASRSNDTPTFSSVRKFPLAPCIFIIDFASRVGAYEKEGLVTIEKERERSHDATRRSMCRGFSIRFRGISFQRRRHGEAPTSLPVQHSIDKPVALNQNEQAKQSLEPTVSHRSHQRFSKRFEPLGVFDFTFQETRIRDLQLDEELCELFINVKRSCTVEPYNYK